MYRYAFLAAVALWIGCSGDDLGLPSGPLPGPGPQGAGSPQTAPQSPSHAPIAVEDTFRIHAGTILVISPPGFLANDIDQDGDSLVAFPSGAGAGVFFNPATGHVEYGGNINMWQESRSRGVAYNWRPEGGFTFAASPDAALGVEEFLYQAYEDGPEALASEPTKIFIIVE